MTAERGLSRNESGSFVLSAALDLTIAGVSQKKAEKLVDAARKICPYSNAVRGNVEGIPWRHGKRREAKERKPCKRSDRP
jgi:organic hydroperoxide reductase OsmC/OhrA